MRSIVLTNGLTTLVDDDTFAAFGAMKWYACRSKQSAERYYVRNNLGWLHRLVMGAPVGTQVDHVDRDPLNNQRGNLRLASPSLNNAHANMRRGGSNRYRGVYWRPEKKRFQARISIAGVMQTLGSFRCEEEAALRYDEAAKAAFGEFAQLNFPGKVS